VEALYGRRSDQNLNRFEECLKRLAMPKHYELGDYAAWVLFSSQHR
jgi:hypothetical protein